MKIILLQDIDNIGKKHDVKKVADGYARNFLFPKKMAVLASSANLKDLEEKKKVAVQKAEEELKIFQDQAGQLDGLELEILAKVQEDGKLFGSIAAANIINKLKERGIEIKKEQIKLKEPIKELGEYEVPVEFPHNLEAKLKVIVVEEK
ncbi:MAG: 50S ribosomal protein L9 [Candidatus Portnoybacteria bacterium RIFCSPLOWO2_12_FULL_39_9]|uniref:Large ribosomal subunit protein bL9 n=1 Tax=Candidatus Portnoybacteria bacterium RIFCSPHIGHO2_12_FULL_38_9 TaxID=1801997 RepID=A0A1G2FE13_9BACT|nr:MAG: 50S ribosomal protein L9 [Candidatus Portnoybacteria bacterium RBG_13_40_8]OGZ35642.1 MAG: 50S ribosomal protein L9 [Candidatus Portnoybacteria bacterium RIFCSPHIGHO2_02_FULL_39_12]OGZ36295.1 MAG: 50S ribosomal protein L9 [Candidatus Portnoybacteria bacterium RIFCSPHIGHO2_12_FULL_38_9]OGZ38767.1 MAG: 50S ribosomal protein L9 [Candidatus Portnoybacteria bacterium RIFCSPLOWO2_01_FULL_38_39]OGZ40759.1 MAG: 50S ribosomal protein L9 [Candidatus Portnoybacteria bacterium RIFCSPLOWO2_12_FULL_3